jgi:hypothetical protein
MEEQFGTADHFITHFGSRGKTTNRWNTEVFFGGRYTLTMQVDVHVDYDKNQIEVVGEPVFYLVEAESIDVFDDGRTHGHIQAFFGRSRSRCRIESQVENPNDVPNCERTGDGRDGHQDRRWRFCREKHEPIRDADQRQPRAGDANKESDGSHVALFVHAPDHTPE